MDSDIRIDNVDNFFKAFLPVNDLFLYDERRLPYTEHWLLNPVNYTFIYGHKQLEY